MKKILKVLLTIVLFVPMTFINTKSISYIEVGGTISEDLVLEDTSATYLITNTLDIMPGVTLKINPGVTIVGGIDDPNDPEITLNDNALLIIGDLEGEQVALNDVRIIHDETYSPYGEAAIGLANFQMYNSHFEDGMIFLRNSDVVISGVEFSNSDVYFFPIDTVNIDISYSLFINDTVLNVSPQSNSTVNIYNNSFNNFNNPDIIFDSMNYGVSSNVHINNNNFLFLDKDWVIVTNATSENVQVLDLTNNYWRTTDADLISRVVLDHSDVSTRMINCDLSFPESDLISNAPQTEIVMPFAIKELAINDLSGSINVDTTLTLAGSPYYIGSLLSLGENVTLTVEEGVEIFGKENNSTVSNESLIILSSGSNLVLNGSDSNRTKISNININTNQSELFSNTSIYHIISIQNTDFSKVQLNLYDSELTILNNTFTDNSLLTINTFKPSNFSETLINSNIKNNLFESSNIHVYLTSDSDLNIQNNTFNSNEIFDINFEQLGEFSTLENINVNQNNFLNFDKDYIIIADGSSVFNNTAKSIDLSDNYWRSQTTQTIKKYIFDHEDYYGNSISLSIIDTSNSYFVNTMDYTYNTDLVLKNKEITNVLTGYINEDTVLSNNQDKYILNGNLDILPGITLTIEEGITIESSEMFCFNGIGGSSCPGNTINLYGDAKLVINGTETNKVRLNSVRVYVDNSDDSDYSSININYLEGKNSYFYLNKNLSQITNSQFISENILTDTSSSYGWSLITYVNPIINSKFIGNSLSGNSNLDIAKSFGIVSGIEISNNTFYRNDFGYSSSDSTYDIEVRSTNGSDYSNLLINNNNFVNTDKQYFLYTYSDSGDTLDLTSNFWRNLTDYEINSKIYDNSENSNVQSYVDISNQLVDFNIIAPDLDYYYLNGVQDNKSFNHSISINHNFRSAWLNEVEVGNTFAIDTEGEYLLKLEKDDSTMYEINFEIDLTKPIIEGVNDKTLYKESRTISFNEGAALLHKIEIGKSYYLDENGVYILNITEDEQTVVQKNIEISSGYILDENGTYNLYVTDNAGNISSMIFTIEIPEETSTSNSLNSNTNTTYTFETEEPETFISTAPKENVPSTPVSQPTFTERMDSLKALFASGLVTLDSKETITTQLKSLYSEDKKFVSSFTSEEKDNFETLLKEIYKDNLSIENTGIQEISIKGLLLNTNLEALTSGESISYKVDIKEELTAEDKALVDQYMNDQQLDTSNVYSLDINISELINDSESQLTELTEPITLTLPLPESFKGLDNLQVVHVHNGQVEVLEVTINEDGTFSFSTSKLSSFTLVQSKQITEPNLEETTNTNNNVLYYGLGILLIAGLGFGYMKLRKN